MRARSFAFRVATSAAPAHARAVFRTCMIGMGLAAIAPIAAAPSPRAEQPDDEQQIGQEVFKELKARAEIITTSPLYDLLTPVAAPVARTAQPRYDHPFKFYLVHEAQPNAFATPGGNVHVTDALLYFVRNQEELAGTLCHEVSHTRHHDSMNLIEKHNHPDNPHRVAALKEHFREQPAAFGSFSPDAARATRLVAPKEAPVVFLR